MDPKVTRIKMAVEMCLDQIQICGLHPDELMAAAGCAASLYRQGKEAIEAYKARTVMNVGTDSEVCP